MNDVTDQEFYEGIVLRVEPSTDGWEVEWRDVDLPEDHYGMTCLAPDKGIEPHPGDRIRFWGNGLFSPIRGMAINGQTLFYRTAAEQQAELDRQSRDWAAEQRQKFTAGEEAYRLRIAALPDVFRERIAGFERRNPDFAWRYGQYELTCCEDAVKIAAAIPDPAEIHRWVNGLTWEEQREKVPGLYDGHSGNSFGATTRLAQLSLTHPEAVPQEHGALCPLVGCEQYGCWALEAQATS